MSSSVDSDDTSPSATFFGLDKETLTKISAACERLTLGMWIPLLEDLMNGPKAIGRKESTKKMLERIRAAGLVDSDPYIRNRPRLWWLTEQGRLAIAKYHQGSSSTELKQTGSEMETLLRSLSG